MVGARVEVGEERERVGGPVALGGLQIAALPTFSLLAVIEPSEGRILRFNGTV